MCLSVWARRELLASCFLRITIVTTSTRLPPAYYPPLPAKAGLLQLGAAAEQSYGDVWPSATSSGTHSASCFYANPISGSYLPRPAYARSSTLGPAGAFLGDSSQQLFAACAEMHALLRRPDEASLVDQTKRLCIAAKLLAAAPAAQPSNPPAIPPAVAHPSAHATSTPANFPLALAMGLVSPMTSLFDALERSTDERALAFLPALVDALCTATKAGGDSGGGGTVGGSGVDGGSSSVSSGGGGSMPTKRADESCSVCKDLSYPPRRVGRIGGKAREIRMKCLASKAT